MLCDAVMCDAVLVLCDVVPVLCDAVPVCSVMLCREDGGKRGRGGGREGAYEEHDGVEGNAEDVVNGRALGLHVGKKDY
jgi:hypothetical protein